MRVVTDLPHRIREIENTWVPLPGTEQRMAARIFLPETAGPHHPVPAILEYLPYRKRDGTIFRDQLTHPYFAGHGYASIRVDMRGNGDSEGPRPALALACRGWKYGNWSSTSMRSRGRSTCC